MCKLSAVVPLARGRQEQKAAMMLLTSIMLENGRLANKDGWGIGIPETLAFTKRMSAVTTSMIDGEVLNWLWSEYKLGQILMGHVRLSTTAKNEKGDQHAHPFVCDQWMLAHNGHISNYIALANEMKLDQSIAVDSEVALHALAEVWGDASTLTLDLIQKGVDRLEGSYAFLVGNSLEPDRIYAILGSNPLSLYSNKRFHIINTDGQLLGFLNQTSWVMGIGYGYWEEFTCTPLKANHAYAIDKTEGLVELGSFTPKVVPQRAWQGQNQGAAVHTTYHYGTGATTPNSETSGSPTADPIQQPLLLTAGLRDSEDDTHESNLVSPAAASKEVARIQTFLSKYCITPEQVNQMLTELPPTIPSSIWELNQYDLELLDAWFDYLAKKPASTTDNTQLYSVGTMVNRLREWDTFKSMLPANCDPVTEAMQMDDQFNLPPYLNTLATLTGLVGKARGLFNAAVVTLE